MNAPVGRPRLCLVGPMVGRTPGYVTTQGEILSDLLAAEGYPVIATSTRLNRYARLADIVKTLVVRGRSVDIMMIQTFGGPSFVVEDIASAISKLLGCPIVLHLRGGAMPDFMSRFPRWSQRVLSRADRIVVPSLYLSRAVGRYGFSSEIIPNILVLSRYPYRHRETVRPRLLWMRSFHPLYNPALAIRVLARLRATVPAATLVMAGQDKGIQPAIEQLAKSLGVADAVKFVGFLDPAGKAREGDAADIFINTNDIDNTPVAVVEACAMGLPVVSTNIGGVPDLLTEGETGLLVPRDDDRMMADAVLRLLQEPGLAARLSVNGRRLAESSSWDTVKTVWEKLITELGEHSRDPGRKRS
jgi:glycosyltransferase involved in cell wall biosynthesis